MQNTWLSLAISYAILAFSSFFGVFLMSQSLRLKQERMPVLAALTAYFLMGCSAVFGTLVYGFSTDWGEPHRLFLTAARTLAPLLLGCALSGDLLETGLEQTGPGGVFSSALWPGSS